MKGYKTSHKRKVYRRAVNKFLREVNETLPLECNVKLASLTRTTDGERWYATTKVFVNDVLQDITITEVNRLIRNDGKDYWRYLDSVINFNNIIEKWSQPYECNKS